MRVLPHEPAPGCFTEISLGDSEPHSASEARRRSRSAAVSIAISTLLLVAGGCAQRTTATLHQPFASSGQRELRLGDPQAYVRTESEQRVVVASFSRPGSTDGSRDFVLYFVTPAREGVLLADATPESKVRGFLIQMVGELRGKTGIVGGRLMVRAAPWPRRDRYDLSLSLLCEDGASIVGRIHARESSAETRRFERRFAGDVAELTGWSLSEDGMEDAVFETTPPRVLIREFLAPAEN